MNEKVWKVGYLWILVSSLTMTSIVNASCTPTPDCASIGYTETNCEGDSLRCPFDITKLYCIPCDSSFKYDCTGDNITGGVGDTCDGKYASCECETGFNFINGDCRCPNLVQTECLVGAIYYSNGSCSNEYIYCQNPVGVVVKDNTLIATLDIFATAWTNHYIDVEGIFDRVDSAVAISDYNGKSNTLAISDTYSMDTVSNNAGIYCYNYAPLGLESSKNQWYLPALGELHDYIYTNYISIKATWDKVGTAIPYNNFWSSSEYSSSRVWFINFDSGSLDHTAKGVGNHLISCLYAID